MPKYSKECWKNYLADGDAERLVKCIFSEAQKAAVLKGDEEYLVYKGSKALIELSQERARDVFVSRTEIRSRAEIESRQSDSAGLWPWFKGAEVVEQKRGPTEYKIKGEFFDAMAWLYETVMAGYGKRSILELQGLGKEIWEGIDAQEYIDEERNSWDG